MSKESKSRPSGIGKSKALWLSLATGAVVTMVVWLSVPTMSSEDAEVVVYKTPACGCCNKWIAHLRDNDFKVGVVNVRDTRPLQARLGVPRHLRSCHTAVVGNYWVEGHVPADLIRRLVAEKPDDVRGIAVPGMPIGSPGMEGPNPVRYDVLAHGADGNTTVYAVRHGLAH